ncbi:hypothetical protein E2C01_026240 [Portunus trituberculatus]|uniref:Uncharacterized protein n=1 Tax=Portunus trituberculatus TaxID=210409 RepID=A0A5B7EI97_PORTR|nr:hypothetical protein [Portunus trituberculatus]
MSTQRSTRRGEGGAKTQTQPPTPSPSRQMKGGRDTPAPAMTNDAVITPSSEARLGGWVCPGLVGSSWVWLVFSLSLYSRAPPGSW